MNPSSTASSPSMAMLLRVGIDTGGDLSYSPIIEDGRFEFIPISLGEDHESEDPKVKTYSSTTGRTGQQFSDYLEDKKVRNRILHDDPKFDPKLGDFTYGDDTNKKSDHVRELDIDDILIFYAGLRPFKNESYERGLYVVGYFTVEEKFDFREMDTEEKERARDLCKNNAHILEDTTDNLVIIKGKKGNSILFETVGESPGQAFLISERKPAIGGHRSGLIASKRMQSLLGIRPSIVMSMPPIKIPNAGSRKEHFRNLCVLLGITFSES